MKPEILFVLVTLMVIVVLLFLGIIVLLFYLKGMISKERKIFHEFMDSMNDLFKTLRN